MKFDLNSLKIGSSFRPFIVAEMSGNHNQSLDRALEIVDAAAACGVQAIKIQTYTADTMTLDVKDNEFFISDKNSLWHGKSLYELYQQAYTPWDWHKAIFDRCKSHGVFGFSTPFDESAVDFLETLEVPFYKIASFENTDTQLIKRVAKTGKPMVISTGMASISELAESVEAARSAGCKELILLKCTSSYPATPCDSNVSTIPHMREMFRCEVGLSDHTMGTGVSVAAVALGATFIEKHFTLSRAEGGVDSAFSLEPHELKDLVVETERAWQAMGQVTYGAASATEEKSKNFRRTLYFAKPLPAGAKISKDDIRAVRPGLGLPVKHYDLVIGRKLKTAVEVGMPVKWDVLD